ncbi:hypothetical protein ARTHRO9V_160031 [Arthrobacter sp. 9V]|nr:hypothetical protein ARTHRO9V_160031 [Arthrobacter sp. 9V]
MVFSVTRTCSCWHSSYIDDVLNGNRNAVQRPPINARGQFSASLRRRSVGAVLIERDERVDRRLPAVGLLQGNFHKIRWGHKPTPHHAGELGNTKVGEKPSSRGSLQSCFGRSHTSLFAIEMVLVELHVTIPKRLGQSFGKICTQISEEVFNDAR